MKKRNVMHLAVTGALAAIAAQNAFAGIGLKAGDWDLDFGGIVNGFYTYAKCDENVAAVAGGLACVGDKQSAVRNGLLPGALVFSAKTRQNNLDVGVTVGFYPGINSNNTGPGGVNLAGGNPVALGTSGIDARQTFFTFGDKSWGTIKIGRDLGIFGGNAILSDMTLLGVGSTGGNGAPSNTSLGRIGLGYIYADWQPQITYTSADVSGFQFSGGIFSGLTPLTDSDFSVHKSPGIQAQVSYAWTGDFGGKAWLSGVSQKVERPSSSVLPGNRSYTGSGIDAGFKFSVAGFEGVLYGYDGDGIGTTGLFILSNDALGNKRKSNGGYAQGTYKFGDVKLGLSYGESKLKLANNEVNPSLVKSNKSIVGGIYYSLTKSVTLVGEYADTEAKAQDSNLPKNKEKTYILGGILFF